MELELTRIDHDADIYDVRKAIQEVLHGPEFYDPNDRENKGRKPNFQVVLCKSPAGRMHDGKAALRLPTKLGSQLFRWYRESEKHRIVVKGRPLRLFKTDNHVPFDVKQVLEKALYVDPDKDKLRTQTEDHAHAVRLRIAIVQFGVWYKASNSPGTGRSFSVEYERNFLYHSAAYLFVVYEHKLIRIDIGQRETEETKYMILVKFSSIRKLGIGYDDSGQPFIIFDLYTPPTFEQESYNNQQSARGSEGIEPKKKHKTRDRISAIDEAHASIAPYAHHLRLILADQDDLLEFERICQIVECEPLPIRVPRVDAHAKEFFSPCNLLHVKRWIKTMDWKNAFQIEGYLRCGLLNTYDLLITLQKPIEDAIERYGDVSSDFLRFFSEALKTRKADEDPRDCLERMHSEWEKCTTPKPPFLTPPEPEDILQDISCHHVIITPSRILLEGPYPTQSNRVIRGYQDHAPALAERFIRVEFRDEDHLSYRWDGDVDGARFLQRRVGTILRRGFELGGREFEFLAYSTSALREHSVWFVSPFRDPIEGYVTAEYIRSSLGDFSELLRTPSKYAARIAQAFTATYRSIKIRRDQWDEQPDLGPHTDGVGTISPQLADMIWNKQCGSGHDVRERRVKPSAYQFRFLGYKGVVVVDHRLEGIKMRLRKSQRKFPVNDDEEAYFEIAQSFGKPNKVYLNRPAVMALEDRGVDIDTFLALQEKAKEDIYSSHDSLEDFLELLKAYNPGDKFHLVSILDQLVKLKQPAKLESDSKDGLSRKAIKSAFFERLLCYAMHHALRGIKFKARIRVPMSYQLVGVADEGRAYINEGIKEDDVFTLKPDHIYVCIQQPEDDEPTYLKGNCVISRSPVIHPGDVQPVFAVGEPPEDKICFFRGLKNVVVLPAVGERSLASCLGGGDLDGDTYDIYHKNPGLLPPIPAKPAAYPPSEPWTLPEGREATVNDICDFIVEYIHSDVMGLLADRHIVIADQSKDGVFDQRCMRLAELCSQAVDYAKNGNPVDINNNLPKPLIRFKPDWHKAEVTGARELDYYVSDRALGHLFRNVKLHDPKELVEGFSTRHSEEAAPLEDAITCAVEPHIRGTLNTIHNNDKSCADDGFAEQLHAQYVREMRFICVTHTLVDTPDVRLTEEEVVLGTILANSTQSRWRSNRSYRMKEHTKDLVGSIRSQIIQCEGSPTEEQLRAALPHSWAVWCWAQHHRDKEYIESFALLVLGTILDSLRYHGALPETKSTRKKK